ncbi:uncharacterized protein N7477_003401 [Penicillium maclennaniae]|uniref:uncharacterized protein n=1 Tax=Penicillium maclennaniae TaxID=1343394 RepID=UPI0025408705|nr:uncharacterized protein N7477_003401 [Penicillium maclennaniae]KAJ5677768.1 hypothetical protein N7477_003401 [Penicillium maclennaniae]
MAALIASRRKTSWSTPPLRNGCMFMLLVYLADPTTTAILIQASLLGLNPTQPPSSANRLLVTPITLLKHLQPEDLAFSNLAIFHGVPIQDILLTSPKNVFASSRMGSKGSLDMTDRPLRTGNPDDRNDRFNFKDRFFKDRDAIKRIGMLGDPAAYLALMTQSASPDGTENLTDGKNTQTPRDSADERNRDKDGRFPPKKDVQPGRSKFEGSWFRNNENNVPAPDSADADDDKPPRNREWRPRDRHGVDRDWNRGAKFDHEPEWLDSNDRDEPRRAHTQEDFQRWKERMKAGSGAAQAVAQEEKRDAPAESHMTAPKPDGHYTDGEVFSNERSSHDGAPFMADNSMDRFFGMLGGEKPHAQQETGIPIPVDSAAKNQVFVGKPGKSSRFAGLFSPPPESPSKAPESPVLPMASAGATFSGAASSNPDQEGFQRIIAMLGAGGGAGGSRSTSGTPHQIDSSNRSRPQSMVHAEQSRNISSPARDLYPRQDYASPFGLDQAPWAAQPSSLRALWVLPPGLMPDMMPRPPPGPPPGLGVPQKTPAFLNDPAIANMQRPDSEQLRRRAPNGPPMGYFDDVPFHQGGQGHITPGGSRHPQGPNQPPMPLQRPPGLEHLPPPGWTGQPPPQQGNGPSPMGHPPGIPTPGRGMNPGFPPGMMPMPGNPPPLNDRQAFPRFPPMPPNPEMMGLGSGGQGPFGPGNPGPQGPPPSSRHLLEMFGQSNGGDSRGGMVGPPQFR